MTMTQCRRNPIFEALGRDHEFLDCGQSQAATRDERIRSIWPFIVRMSKEFQRTLKPRERVNFDAEDTLTELWIAIAERDHKWSPDRGKYITFAGRIISNKLFEIRDRARTIESPRNSSCRMNEYLSEEAAGTITPERQKTADDIRRTGEGAQALGETPIRSGIDSDPVNVLLGRECDRKNRDAIMKSIRTLTTYEATVIGRLCGIGGQKTKSVFGVAWETVTDPADVRKARASAVTKIHDFLLSVGHPVTEIDG